MESACLCKHLFQVLSNLKFRLKKLSVYGNVFLLKQTKNLVKGDEGQFSKVTSN